MTANVSSFPLKNPDIVFVGAGPVNLWTAVQTKILTDENAPNKNDLNILVVEKYPEYKRADIRLNIEASSFSGVPDYEPLKTLTQKWGNQPVPIKELQEGLEKCAHDLGISILKGKAVNPHELQEQYPTAKMFIGGDGARSAMRKELFGDAYKFNTPLQYLVQVQYLIKTPGTEQDGASSYEQLRGAATSYKKQKFAGHLITQSIRPQENGNSQVTLRIFVSENTYRAMADAVFSNPYYFESDLDKVPDSLRRTLIKWWGSQTDQEIICEVKKTNKITVIPLASYAAKDVFKMIEKKGDPDDAVAVALVGDASQAFPFFRAINNGLLLGTRLAQCVARAFEGQRKAEKQNPLPDGAEKRARREAFAARFTSYSRYSTFRAYVERIRAFVKNLFIVFSSLWIKASSNVPWQTVTLNGEEREEFWRRGAEIWEKLSGAKPLEMAQEKAFKD